MEDFVIQTERLLLRPHRYDDIPFMVQLNADPEVTRYTGDGPIDEGQAREIVARLCTQFQQRKIGRFMAIEKSSGQKIGWSGLAFLQDRGVVDLGYRLLRNRWGLGYATESAQACLQYGFNTLEISEITARVDALNHASIHVLRKLGMSQSELHRDDKGEFYDFIILRKNFCGSSSKLGLRSRGPH